MALTVRSSRVCSLWNLIRLHERLSSTYFKNLGVIQLVECVIWDHDAGGSSPSTQTKALMKSKSRQRQEAHRNVLPNLNVWREPSETLCRANLCRSSLMVELMPSKHLAGVRFPSVAPKDESL